MNFYLERYSFTSTLIPNPPSHKLGMVVVIPCFNETGLIQSLESLLNSNLPTGNTEVIIIINGPENAPEAISEQNQASYMEVIDWIKTNNSEKLCFHAFNLSLPAKDAGVGLARKIGMDEAVRRFDYSKNHDKGIIVCFDADSGCESNYLSSIEEHFNLYPNSPGASIYFEHPLEGCFDEKIHEGIIHYELFLRYYVNALRYTQHPFAFQTIGSSMAVRSAIYQKQGGMNKRKAGEDFYFLQKIIPLGNYTEINSTRVIPSPRPSNRVPFGTGKAINDWLQREELAFYQFRIFEELKTVIASTPLLFNSHFSRDSFPPSIAGFLEKENFDQVLKEIKGNTSTYENFVKRFFRWFNGFRVLKYVHHATAFHYPKSNGLKAVQELVEKIAPGIYFNSEKEYLLFLRNKDRNTTFN